MCRAWGWMELGVFFLGGEQLRGFAQPHHALQGSVYQKTNAMSEIKRVNKDNFWAKAEVSAVLSAHQSQTPGLGAVEPTRARVPAERRGEPAAGGEEAGGGGAAAAGARAARAGAAGGGGEGAEIQSPLQRNRGPEVSPWGLGHVPSSRSRDAAGGAGGTLRGRVSCVRVSVCLPSPGAGEAPSIAPRGQSLPQLPGAAPAVLSPSPRGRGTKHRCPFVTLCHRRRLQQEAERRDREQQQRVSSSAGLSEGLGVPNPGGAPPRLPAAPPLVPISVVPGGWPRVTDPSCATEGAGGGGRGRAAERLQEERVGGESPGAHCWGGNRAGGLLPAPLPLPAPPQTLLNPWFPCRRQRR